MASTNSEDEFSKKLKEQKKALEECQNDKNVKSCNECDKIIGCDIRRNYVKSVYDSMSKGATGGFEF